jgi:hypothetical protein
VRRSYCEFTHVYSVGTLTVSLGRIAHNVACTWGERVTIFRELWAEASPRGTEDMGLYFYYLQGKGMANTQASHSITSRRGKFGANTWVRRSVREHSFGKRTSSPYAPASKSVFTFSKSIISVGAHNDGVSIRYEMTPHDGSCIRYTFRVSAGN